MKQPEELQTLVDEVHRKIGRNLMLLQHVESMFKTLLIHSRVIGASQEDIDRFRSERKKEIEGHTLGMLAGKFTSEVLVRKGVETPVDEPELPAGSVTFRYTVQAEHDYVKQRTDSLKVIVEERNELVHHFLAKWNRLSMESTLAASEHLDQQHSRVVDEAKTMKNYLEGLQRISGLQHNLMSSPEYEKQMEMIWLQNSRIVLWLVEMSINALGTTGWVRLADAGRALWSEVNEDMAEMKAMYGYEKLKPLILASEVFDLREEALKNGGDDIFFKLKSEARPLYEGQLVPTRMGQT